MLTIGYAPKFVREYKKLPLELQQEIKTTIESLRDPKNHERLRVHKLGGRLKNRFSCSVNYQYRILFIYLKDDCLSLLTVGDHDVYR